MKSEKKPYFKQTLLTILVGLVAGVTGSLFTYYITPAPEPIMWQKPDTTPAFTASQPARPYWQADYNEDFVQASATATPSVVYIKTTAGQEDLTWFDLFYYGGQGRTPAVSSGSGVLYSADGYVITNNHVVQQAEIIEVIHNKKIYQAELIGTDPSTDIALLKIEGKNMPAVKVAKSINVQVGEWVLAVGNPFNLTSTVTAGIVSAKGRNLHLLKGDFPMESFIQTDAAINPGNSGGALVNMRGELVGINTAIYSRTGSYAGYGFAVPSDIVSKVVGDLIKYGEVQRVVLGVKVSDLTGRTASRLDIDDLTGVIVTYTQKSSAAYKAGLRQNDIIFQIGNEKITGKGDYDEALSYYYPGEEVSLKYKRGEEVKTAKLVLTNREGTTSILQRQTINSEPLGALLSTVPSIERERLKIEAGVKIFNLRSGLLKRMNLNEGFILTRVNNILIDSPEKLEKMFKNLRGTVVIEGIEPDGSRVQYSYRFR